MSTGFLSTTHVTPSEHGGVVSDPCPAPLGVKASAASSFEGTEPTSTACASPLNPNPSTSCASLPAARAPSSTARSSAGVEEPCKRAQSSEHRACDAARTEEQAAGGKCREGGREREMRGERARG
eukprot:337210-Rhodomonas_salina.2